jgi:hypothetical protein
MERRETKQADPDGHLSVKPVFFCSLGMPNGVPSMSCLSIRTLPTPPPPPQQGVFSVITTAAKKREKECQQHSEKAVKRF